MGAIIGLVFVIILIGIVISLFISTISIAPWVPTRRRDLKRIFELADLKEGEQFYDLGCGTGTTVFYGARNSKATCNGVELSFALYIFCKARKFLSGTKNTNFILKNAYNVDLSNADVIYVFGMVDRFEKLLKKLKTDLKPGTRIISYAFKLPGLEPLRTSKPSDRDLPVYLYRI